MKHIRDSCEYKYHRLIDISSDQDLKTLDKTA